MGYKNPFKTTITMSTQNQEKLIAFEIKFNKEHKNEK